jgi:hypothetical protein
VDASATPELELRAAREAIASGRQFHDLRLDVFRPAELAVDALRGLLGALRREHPHMRFSLNSDALSLRRLGLGPGYLQVGSDLVFVHATDVPSGHIRLGFVAPS